MLEGEIVTTRAHHERAAGGVFQLPSTHAASRAHVYTLFSLCSLHAAR